MGITSFGKRLFQCLGSPARVKAELLRLTPATGFSRRVDYDLLPRTHYGYCMYQAALQAKRLGLSQISAIEFGVGGGGGLIEMENYAEAIERETGVAFQVWGFDTGSGMPKTDDPRDMLYVWQPGFFAMDVEGLKKKLRRAELVLGDVRASVPEFIAQKPPAPIGFISFDLDYYSSTRDAFKLFENDNRWFLPRVFCYFDDIIGDDAELHSEFSGELLAIDEFNRAHEKTKIGRLHLLRHKRRIPAPWNDVIYVCHRFDHPDYNKHQGGGVWNYSGKN